MTRLLIAASALALSSPAWADTLYTNVNGLQADADGKLLSGDEAFLLFCPVVSSFSPQYCPVPASLESDVF